LKFRQETWLKPYVDFNTMMRRNSKNDFEKNYFKLMVNAYFGKTMESVRKRSSVKITNEESKALRLASDPRCKSWDILDEKLVMINLEKKKVILSKPIYVGFTILDVSKYFMFKFHYENIISEYGVRAKLLFSDTDSLCYEIQTADVFEDMKKNLDLYDTSDYPKNHMLYSDVNKKKLGKFKDEAGGRILAEFIGLSSKMYSIIGSDIRKKACKGTVKRVIDENVEHEVYKKALFEGERYYFTMNSLRSYKHRIFTISMNKLCVHSMDTKRYICENGVDTLSLKLRKVNKCE